MSASDQSKKAQTETVQAAVSTAVVEPVLPLRITKEDIERLRKNVPPEFFEVSVWSCAARQPVEGGSGIKRPLRPGGGNASSTDKASWASFDQCAEYALENPDMVCTIGVHLAAARSITVLDFDNVMSEGKLIKEATDYIGDLPGTWTEVSLSGNGLHLLYSGRLPEGCPAAMPLGDDAKVELFSRSPRFMALTGRLYGEELPPHALTDAEGDLIKKCAQDAMGAFRETVGRAEWNPVSHSDDELLGKVETALKLLDPDVLPYEDWAYMMHAAEAASRDGQPRIAAAIHDWTRSSVKHQESDLDGSRKWSGERISCPVACIIKKAKEYIGEAWWRDWRQHPAFRGGSASGASAESTVDGFSASGAATQLAPGTKSNPRANVEPIKFRTTDELAADTTTQEWLLEGFIFEKTVTVVAGQPAAGKSFWCYDLAEQMAAGREFHGIPLQSGGVCYFAGEGTSGHRKRTRAWRVRYPDSERKHVCAVFEDVPALNTDNGFDVAVASIKSYIEVTSEAPKLVVIDTLSQAFGDGDENDAKTVAPALKRAEGIKAMFGCAVIVVHHVAKHGDSKTMTLDSIRGSGALGGNVDGAIGIARYSGGVRFVKQLKLRDAEESATMRFELHGVATGIHMENGDEERSAAIVRVSESENVSAGGPVDHMRMARKLADDAAHAGIVRTDLQAILGIEKSSTAKSTANRVLAQCVKSSESGLKLQLHKSGTSFRYTAPGADPMCKCSHCKAAVEERKAVEEGVGYDKAG